MSNAIQRKRHLSDGSTPRILDCLAEIESRWHLEAADGSHRGVHQMNKACFNGTSVPLSFKSNVGNTAARTMVVVAGLYNKLAAARADQMRRFEVRECRGGVQVLAFEQGAVAWQP